MQYNKFIPLFFNNRSSVIVGYYTLTSTRYVSAIQIVVKSDTDEVKEMIRLIPVYETQTAGTYPIVWDGYDYLGNDVIATNDYEANVLHSDLTYDYWILGSNSTLKHGPTTFRGYSANVGVFFVDNKAYFNHSWDEGQNIKGCYVDRNVDIHSQGNVLYGGVTHFSGPAFEFGCSTPDGTMVIYGGENSSQGFEGDNIVYGIDPTDDTEILFSAGTSYNAGLTTYAKVLYQGMDKISGITATNDYVYVTFSDIDTIRIYALGTIASPDGTEQTADTSFTAPIVYPQSYDAYSGGDRIWLMNKTTSQVYQCSVNGGTGALTVGSLTLSFGSGHKYALAVDNVNHNIAFAYGGAVQQIKFFDISAAAPTGSEIQVFGVAGGYEAGNTDCAIVQNDKFAFSDASTDVPKGTPRGYLAFSGDGEFWVGDTGNRRTQIFSYTYSSTYTFTFEDHIDQVGAIYNPCSNLKDPTEQYITGLRYAVDLDTGDYTLTHNYFSQLAFANINGRDIFNYVTNYTTVDGVKKLAIINEYGTTPSLFPLVELTDDGVVPLLANMADTGAYLSSGVDEDFTITSIYSASYAVGQTPIIRQKYLTYSSPNFSQTGYTTIVTLDPIVARDTQSDGGNTSYAGFSGTGNFLFSNSNKDGATDYIIELSNPAGEKKWRCITRTAKEFEGGVHYVGHQGQMPPPNWVEAANGVNDMFSITWSKGDFWGFSANYEDYKGKQGNYFYLGHKIGVPIYLFGTNRWKSEAIEDHGIEADGNCQFFHAVYSTSNILVVHSSSEGGHAGSQIRVIRNLDDVTVTTVDVNPPTYEVIRGARQLLEISPISIFTDTTHIVLSEVASVDFDVETNIMWPDVEAPDLYVASTADGSNHDRYAEVEISPARVGSMKHWELNFPVTFMGHSSVEATDFPGTYVRVVDAGGKIIARIGLGILVQTYRLWANNTVIKSTTSENDVKNYLYEWNNCYIKCNSLGCKIVFGNEAELYCDIVDPTADWTNPTHIHIGGETKTGGSGVAKISVKQNMDYYDTTSADPAPLLISAETITSTEIQLTFDSAVTASELGFSLTEDANPLSVISISGAFNVWNLTVDAMSVGTTLLLSYSSTTGDTVNADAVDLATFGNFSVTNNVIPVSFTIDHNSKFGGNGFNLDYSSGTFTTVGGETIDVPTWTFAYLDVTSVTDLAGNTYVSIADDTVGHNVYRAENVGAYTNNVVTINLSGFGSAGAHVIVSTGIVASASVEAPVDIATSTGSTTVTSGTITTAQANEVIFAYSYGGTPWTPPAGYTDLGTDANDRVNASYKVLSSTFSGTITSETVADTTDKTLITIKSKLA